MKKAATSPEKLALTVIQLEYEPLDLYYDEISDVFDEVHGIINEYGYRRIVTTKSSGETHYLVRRDFNLERKRPLPAHMR
jgi:hypothetical protein